MVHVHQPEVAHVGLGEREANSLGIAVDTVTTHLADIDRAVLDGEDQGFLRLHLKKGTDRILGATLVAEHAGDMIAGVCIAIGQGIGLKKLAGTLLPYPTQGEVLKKAAEDWSRASVTPFKRRLRGLRLWLRK